MPKTIRMMCDFLVAPDGHTVEKWINGEVYSGVPDDLAADMIADHRAVEVTGDQKADDAAAEAAREALRLAVIEVEEAVDRLTIDASKKLADIAEKTAESAQPPSARKGK